MDGVNTVEDISDIVCEESSRKLSPVQSAADINMRDQ